MDTTTQLETLIKLTDEANKQRESLLRRIENIESFIKHINQELNYLSSELTTRTTQDGEN
ncbi:hypothetical protein [Campylobacter sp. RM16187]|uniref:hypothetical protein n=1 Tax=Campylobacter sp. RM16187 TaxID=1660063 RepID=UPI0021B4D573|nr:hypothetical protein [Campylobacter sp. RM16187]